MSECVTISICKVVFLLATYVCIPVIFYTFIIIGTVSAKIAPRIYYKML